MTKTQITLNSSQILYFPEIPFTDELKNAAICSTEIVASENNSLPQYFLLLSSARIWTNDEGQIFFDAREKFEYYLAVTEGSNWMLKTKEEDKEINGYIGTPVTYTYLWSNVDIYDYDDVALATPAVVHQKAEWENIDGADEPVGFSILPALKEIYQGEKPYPLEYIAFALDGGEISYEWHERINGKDGGVVSQDNIYYASADVLGDREFYCLLTNSRNNTRTTVITSSTTIRVVEGLDWDKTTIIMGYLTARMLRATQGEPVEPEEPEQEPVAFLYNGVRLPGLPVVEGCPHEYVFTTLGGYQVFLTPVPLVRLSNGAFSAPKEVGTVTAIQYDYFEGNPDWGYQDEYELSYDNYRLYNTLKWSNTNVYNEDTTLYMVKSEPVPVYEQEV